MKKEQFTPGPYRLNWPEIVSGEGDSYKVLAIIRDTADLMDNVPYATGKLLAAAPDMYEALKGFEVFENEAFLFQFDNLEQALEQLRSVAKKAKAALLKANPQ